MGCSELRPAPEKAAGFFVAGAARRRREGSPHEHGKHQDRLRPGGGGPAAPRPRGARVSGPLAGFLAFAVETDTAPIASRQQKTCEKSSGGGTGFIFPCSCSLRGAGDRSAASLLAHALIDAILIRRGLPLKPSGATRIAESMPGFGGITPGGDPHCGSGCCRSSDRLSINITLRVRERGRAEDECPQRRGQHDATRMLDEAEERRCRHGRNLRAR